MKISAAIKYQREKSQLLKSKVLDFKREYPYASAKDASQALGISYSAVARYFREAKSEENTWQSLGDISSRIIKKIGEGNE